MREIFYFVIPNVYEKSYFRFFSKPQRLTLKINKKFSMLSLVGEEKEKNMSLARSLQRFRNRNRGIQKMRNKFHFEQLEPRLLLSGDLPALTGTGALKDALFNGGAIFIESEENSGPLVDMALADPTLPPLGSMIHTSSLLADFSESGEEDTYTLDLDSGQTITLSLQPKDPSIRSRIDVYDPYDTLLGSAIASDYGEPIFLQILPITNAGTYRIVAKSVEGAGEYEASYWLNSIIETENLGGENNNELDSAIEISPSSIPISDGGDRLSVVGITDDGTYDYYYFGLGEGEVATIGLTLTDDSLSGESIVLELIDSSGNLLTLGQNNWENIDKTIREFVAPSEGVYYARVSGLPGQGYTLIVTRSSGFDLEPNSQIEEAQDISGSGVILGGLGRAQEGGSGEIRVAVVGTEEGDDSGLIWIVNQLNDDSYFDFDATLVSPYEVDTLEELQAYDVVVIGGTGYEWNQFYIFASALLPYVESGGGLVTTGWGIYASQGLGEGGMADEFNAVVPVNTILGYSYIYEVWISSLYSHPIVEGINSLYVDTYIEYPWGGVDEGATVLATVFDEELGEIPVAASIEIGAGRSVYLGPIYAGGSEYYTDGLRSGDGDRLLEQAVAWAGKGGADSVDNYLIQVNAGDELIITTSTPGDGSGEPLNDLDPMLGLYDPDGNLIASDDNSAGDGRNAKITYEAEDAGVYLIRVSSVSGGGEYVLQIEGATGLISKPFQVVNSSIADGEILNNIDEGLTLTFSEPILLTTLEAGDLTVNGNPIAAFTIIDADTINFDISSLITDDGYYHLMIDYGLLKDIHGTDNETWALSFIFDTTYPEVTETSISNWDVVPPGTFTFKATFSEDMATSGVGAEDIWVIENFSGTKIDASSLLFDEPDQITAEFPFLGDGFYILTIENGASAFRDLAGNSLNGGKPYTLDFFVDSDITQIPVPLNSKLPDGSLIFDPPIESAFHETGDMDAYTIELDSGQTISVQLNPLDGSFQGRLRVFDPSDNLLGEVTSSGAGMITLLQTMPVEEAGTYRIEAESVDGVGRYQMILLLNSLFEDGGESIDSAQDIDSSFIYLNDMSRGAVRGDINNDAGSDEDWYSFTLNEGEATTITLTHDSHDQSPNVSLRLFDGTGNLLTIGMSDAFNVDRYIENFVPIAAGTYYVMVGGTTPGNYSLVITRNSGFDLEPNSQIDEAQDIFGSGVILGGLGFSGGGGGGGAIRVAVLGEGNTVNQLNDNTYFNFTATSVVASQIDTINELNNYDVVVMGAYQSKTYLNQIAPALRQWVEAGHGIVATGWTVYYAGSSSGAVVADIDAIVPVNLNSSFYYNYYPIITITESTHPVTEGITSFSGSSKYAESTYGGIDSGATILGTISGYPAVVVKEVGSGRGVYLSPVYPDYDWTVGMADRLLEQAVAWAGTGSADSVDNYLIKVNTGDELTITTSTPGDGSGEPLNDLDPMLELYDAEGNLVASDNNSALDGRNAIIEYQVPSEGGGIYRVKVISEGRASGTYLLKISGATQVLEPFTVTSTNPEDSSYLNIYPDKYRINLSAPVLFTSVETGDLKVNGVNSDSVILVDADTIEFSISSSESGDGEYLVTIEDGAFISISGQPISGFSSIFYYDTAPPTIISSSVEEGEILTPGDLTLTFTISEDLALSNLGAEDVHLVNIANGKSYDPSNFIYDSETDMVTVEYSNLPEGSYTLTLISGGDAFRDLAGNLLNGDTGSPEPDNYILHFNMDEPLASIPALTPMKPYGSLIYEVEVEGRALHQTGDVDSFTISLDSGQTLTIAAMPSYGDIRMGLEVFGPDNTSLAYAVAGSIGEVVLIQTISTNTAGAYRIEVRSLEGIGQYDLGVLLNAAAEWEMIGGPANDTLATAQDLSGSFILTGSDRAAVVGMRYNDPDSEGLPFFNGHFYKLVTTAMDWLSAKTYAEARTYLGVSGHLATITSLEESLFITNTFGTSINGAWIGGYQPEGSVEPAGGWSWVTGEPFIFTNWGSGEPNNAGGSEHYIQFRSDADSEGKLWNDLPYWYGQYFLVEYDISAEDDWYFVNLEEGQKASFLLTPEGSFSTSNLSLEVYGSGSNLLTASTDQAVNVDEVVLDFVAPAEGNYYLRVSGNVVGDYTLVITRDQSFEIGFINSNTIQDITPTGEVLGGFSFSGGGGGGGAIRVAVLGGGNTVNQLNDNTYFNFTATSVVASQIDTIEELNNYDVVVMGAYQSKTYLNQIAPALRQWVEAGHGIVATGWTVYYAGSSSGAVVTDIDAIVPVNLNSSYYYNYYPTITITDNTHPVTEGITTFSQSYRYAESTYGGIDSGATILGNVSGYPAVVVKEVGSGKGVYLSPVYPDYDWTTGLADRLLEQAVSWASSDSYDDYLIQVNEGDTLTIYTFTPGDGIGEPLNLLDPMLELYDPDGNLVASDTDSSVDGRNAELTYTALIAGGYKIRVLKEEGSRGGEYVLKVAGATGTTNLAPWVVSTNPPEGKKLSVPPTGLTIDLSEGIRADSVGIDDLTIDGDASVTGIEIIDGDTIRFLLSVPDIEGTYTYNLLEDGIKDLLGQGNNPYTGRFVIDYTPPYVVSQTPEVQSLSPFNTWSVTFSEPLDPSSVQSSDFILRNPNNSSIYISSATLSSDGLTVTLTFGNQYTQGNYTLTVGPEITDLAGNRMDQDSETEGNQTYVGTVQVAAPDLTPVSISITLPDGSPLPSEGVLLGSTVRVSWTVRNIGNDAARASYWYDRIWFSTNSSLSVSGDISLAYQYIDVDPLPGNGGQYIMTRDVTLPLDDTVGEGTYYIKIQVDQSNYQPETNEGNNIIASAGFTTIIPPLPDLVVTDVTIPSIVEAGKTAHIEWTDLNQGDAPTTGGGWNDRIVLSINTTFGDSDDVIIYSSLWYYGTLDAGGSINRSLEVTIPTNAVGYWYILIMADYYNSIYERGNEGNNVGVSDTQMNVVVATEDLSPFSFTAPDSALFGETIDVGWTVQNIGIGPTVSNWYDRVWLSRDETPGNADDINLVQIYSNDVTPLGSGAQYSRSITVRPPLNPSWNSGSYYLVLQTDALNHEPETNENNNTMVRSISLTLPSIADLTVSDVSVSPSDINSGDIVELRYTITNNGTASAGNFWDRIYLNNDNILDGYYTQVLSEFLFNDTINPGESREVVQNVTIPINRPGDWYLIVWTDINNNIYEHQNENNNQAVSNQIHATLPPLPDLFVNDILAPKDALSGQTIPITWTIKNQGSRDIVDGQWTDVVYFSYDGGTSNNYYVGTYTFTGSLGAGQSVTRQVDVTLPSTLDGKRWVVIYTDANNNYYEHDGENNNRMVDDAFINVKFPPLPNLQVTSITPPSNLYSSQNALITWQVTNSGTGATSSPSWWDEVRLSLNDIYGDGDDIYLGRVQNPSYLPSGESYENSLSFTVPQGLSGYFYFLVKTDVWNNVFESEFENDNILASSLTEIQLTPPPDLQVTEVVAPSDAFSGQSISLSWTVTNEGDGRTLQTAWYDRVYMSSDTIIDRGDTYLGEVWHSGALDQGESYSVIRNFNLPIGVMGDFYFIVRTDFYNHVYEHASESNNDGYDATPTTILLTPPPDLEVTEINIPGEALAGHSINIIYRVENFGATETPNTSWLDTIWLSGDTQLDSSDIKLSDLWHYGKLGETGSMTFPSYYDRSAALSLPNGISGEYYIIIHTDSRNDVFEGFPNSLGEGPNANNILASSKINVLLRPADLIVESFTVPSEGEAGKQIEASWVVRNIGSGDTITNSWGCRIIASRDDIPGDEDDFPLKDFYHTGLLNSGQGYTATGLIDLPFSMASGDYILFVITDFGNSVYESDDTNNWLSSPLTIIRQTPDLQVVSGSSSDTGMVGGTIYISFRVENLGENRTNSNFWYDDVHLSRDEVLGSGDVYLGNIRHTNILESDEGYNVSASFTLPFDIQTGNWYIIIRTDSDNRVIEDLGEGNNILSIGPITITPYDPKSGIPIPTDFLRPDLQVISVEAPEEAISGQTLTLSWSVGNFASDPTGQRSWYDLVYLSRDPYFDNSDIYLGYRWQSRNLGSGESYTEEATFNIPFGQSGPFYVFVVTDGSKGVTESNENNNFGYDSEFLNVILAPPADLVLDTITIPVNGIPGQVASITYSVNNQGVNPALGSWKDTLYLSSDDVWDINDSLFGSKYHNGPLIGGGSYSETITAPLPGLTPGDYYVILRTDILNNVPESNEINNIGASLDQITMDVESLELGIPATGNLGSGQAVYYRLDVEEGETVRIKLDSSVDDIANELYVSYGSMPNIGVFDYASREGFNPDPEILIPTTSGGTYYIMAYGQWVTNNPSYTILAEAIPFSITNVKANRLGNSGDSTVHIEGAKFSSGTQFFLVAPDDTEIQSRHVYLENSSSAYVTFGLFGASIGLYDLKAIQSNGSTTILSDAIEIIEGEGPAVYMSIYGPEQVMVNRLSIFSLNYVNDGDADTMAPLLVMESQSATPLGFSASDLRTTPFHIMGASMDGPMDILRPDSMYSIPVVFNSGSVAKRLDIRVGRIMPDDSRLIEDWSSIEAIIRPSTMSETEWNNFWGRIQPQIGSTWGDYVKLLNRMMVMVSEPGHPVRDVREIFARMYEQNPDFIPYSAMSVEVCDSMSGNSLADLEVAAYLINENGERILQGRALTDENGNFSFGHLIPGTYEVAVIGRAFDMDRDGVIDLDLPQFIVNETEPLNIGTLYIQPVGVDTTDDDSNPALVQDANGITHIVWNQDGLVLHAWFDSESGNWRDAVPISTEQSYAPSIAASPYLIDGVSPGIIVTWQQGSGNDAEIYYAVARSKEGGGYEWSSPVQLTDDDVLETSPEVIIGDTGVAMIVYLKRDASIQDDSDLYYNMIAIFESALTWPSSEILETDFPIEAEGVTISWGREWKFGPWDFFGTEAEVKLALSGQVGENNCKASLSASGQLSGSFKGSSIRSTIQGSGNVGAEWSADEVTRDWKFDRATAGWSAGAQFDWRYGLSTLLSKIPHPAVTAAYGLYKAAIYLGEKIGLEFEDGITFGGNANFTNMEWRFTQPFPDFVWPETISEASISGLIGVYAQLDVKPTGDSVRVEGNLTVNVDIAPEVKLNSVTGNIVFSGNIGPFPFNETFTVTLYQSQGLESLDAFMEPQDDEPLFDPSALIGTGNSYGLNHVLSDISSDLLNDSIMSMANDDGTIFGAWQQMADPYGEQFGYIVKAAEFTNGWSTPVIIPDSLGINSYVTSAVDGDGDRLVLWSFADSSSLGDDFTMADYEAVSNNSNIVYSIYDDNLQTWSSPIIVAVTDGSDYGVAITSDGEGNLILTWINKNGDLNYLLTSTWDGTAWSNAQVITYGASILSPSIERLGDNLIVIWAEDTNPDPGQVEKTLKYSIYNGSSWSSSVNFDPISLSTGMVLSAGEGVKNFGDSELTTEAIFPPFPVPEECFKCKPEDIKRITESAPVCREGGGTEVTFDEKTCTEKTIVYQPCARRPRDPNDIIGPAGFGDEHWVSAKDIMGYTIHFENAPDATASAQEVVITQQLDEDLDWRTFRVDDFGFGDKRIELEGNQAFYKGRLDFSEELGFYLDVLVNIDITAGIATWKLTTIDPETGEIPVDPNLGFLPPNKNPETGEKDGRGEGFVSYTVKPKRTVFTDDVIDAEATIVFDTEGPISTPPYFNTLDAVAPSSQVNAFTSGETIDPEFLVSWVGSDDEGGSAIMDYTVYVSEDGGPFSVWLFNTTLTESIFKGESGHIYSFYSTARDNAGNEEAVPSVPDATITVKGFGSISGVKFEDMDSDGVFDTNELGLSGWTIYLDMDNDGVFSDGDISVITSEDGSYVFENLETGTYIVREELKSGWIQTAPLSGSFEVTVSAGSPNNNLNFGNFQLGEVKGVVFNDLDADGNRDLGEEPLGGWTIFVDMNGNGSLDDGEQWIETGSTGEFSFTGIGPSTVMRVGEVSKDGWARTTPEVTYRVRSGFSQVIDIGNVQLGSLSGIKFNDFDGDGIRDNGEPGLSGWIIFLDSNADGVLGSNERWVETEEDGSYRFDGLLPGLYIISEVEKDGWIQTSPLETVEAGFSRITTSGSRLSLQTMGFG